MLKSCGKENLVGNKLSKADSHLVELIYHVEELDSGTTADIPLQHIIYLMTSRDSPTFPIRESNIQTLGLVFF